MQTQFNKYHTTFLRFFEPKFPKGVVLKPQIGYNILRETLNEGDDFTARYFT